MKMTCVLLLATTLATACTPMTEAQREAREYERTEFRQQFIEDRSKCNASGHTIFFEAGVGQVDRHGIPKSRVYYVCG